MKKRFAEEQIIVFLKEAEAGISVKELCRRYDFRTSASTSGGRSLGAGQLR